MDTVISVKTDAETKREAQDLAKSVGLTLSALVNSYLKQVVATRRIELYAPEPMTPSLEKMIAQVEAEIAGGKVSKGYTNAHDFLDALKKK